MKHRFPDTDIELEFRIEDDILVIALFQKGTESARILVDKIDLANSFKKFYFS